MIQSFRGDMMSSKRGIRLQLPTRHSVDSSFSSFSENRYCNMQCKNQQCVNKKDCREKKKEQVKKTRLKTVQTVSNDLSSTWCNAKDRYHSMESRDSGVFDESENELEIRPKRHPRLKLRSKSDSSSTLESSGNGCTNSQQKQRVHSPLKHQRTFRIDSIDNLQGMIPADCGEISQRRFLSEFSKRHSQPENLYLNTRSGSSASGSHLTDTRLVILGAGGVGKSSLVAQFINKSFSTSYTPTLQDSHMHLVQLPGGVIQTIEIIDTAGFHQFPAMQNLSILSGNAFIVVYSVNDLESFQEALNLVDTIKGIKSKQNPGTYEQINNWPILVVGNKCDLEDERKIAKKTVDEMLAGKNCYSVEASAKNNVNVDKLFTELLVVLFGVGKVLEELSKKNEASTLKKNRRFSCLGTDNCTIM